MRNNTTLEKELRVQEKWACGLLGGMIGLFFGVIATLGLASIYEEGRIGPQTLRYVELRDGDAHLGCGVIFGRAREGSRTTYYSTPPCPSLEEQLDAFDEALERAFGPPNSSQKSTHETQQRAGGAPER